MSSLSKEAIVDMEKSFAALKKGRSMELHFIAPKTTEGAPWVIADKAGKAGPRLLKAVKLARADTLLNASKVLSGRLERLGDQMTFVVPSKEDVDQARKGISGVWNKALRIVDATGVDIGHLRKIAIILASAEIATEDSFTLSAASAPPPSSTQVSPPEEDNWQTIFGGDAAAIQDSLPTLAALHETLTVSETLSTTSGDKLKEAIQTALSSKSAEVVDQITSAIPDFVAMCATETAGSARALKAGDKLPLGDVVKSLGSDFLKLLDALTYWEDLLGEARDYSIALNDLEATQADWGDDERALHTQTLASYEKTRTSCFRAQARVSTLKKTLQKRMTAFAAAQTP